MIAKQKLHHLQHQSFSYVVFNPPRPISANSTLHNNTLPIRWTRSQSTTKTLNSLEITNLILLKLASGGGVTRWGRGRLGAWVWAGLKGRQGPDAWVHRHWASTANDTALINQDRVLLDGNVVQELLTDLGQTRQSQTTFVQLVLELTNRVEQLIDLADQPEEQQIGLYLQHRSDGNSSAMENRKNMENSKRSVIRHHKGYQAAQRPHIVLDLRSFIWSFGESCTIVHCITSQPTNVLSDVFYWRLTATSKGTFQLTYWGITFAVVHHKLSDLT